MATKLQCEICGGKLIGKPDGVFECEYCGTEYSTEWAKAKIQEIRGTVRVEGPVTVTGSVSIEGAATVNSLLKRGFLHLEDHSFTDAQDCFNRVLDIDPEAADAYLGRLLVRFEAANLEELKHYIKSPIGNADYQRAFLYGDMSLREKLQATVAGAKASFLADCSSFLESTDTFQLPLIGKTAFDFIDCTGGVGSDPKDTASSGRDDMQYTLYGAELIVSTEPVATIQSLLPSLEQAVGTRKPVLLLCRNWELGLLPTLGENARRGVFQSFAVKNLTDQDFQRIEDWIGSECRADGIIPNVSLRNARMNQDFLLFRK